MRGDPTWDGPCAAVTRRFAHETVAGGRRPEPPRQGNSCAWPTVRGTRPGPGYHWSLSLFCFWFFIRRTNEPLEMLPGNEGEAEVNVQFYRRFLDLREGMFSEAFLPENAFPKLWL